MPTLPRTPVLLLASFLLPAAAAAAAQAPPSARLESSSRHHESVKIPAGARTLAAWVVYPEVKAKAPVVVVIHENKGLTEWVRGFADQLAEAGYIAVAPDLLSGFDAEHPDTASFGGDDAARTALYKLDAGRVLEDLTATVDYASTLPAGNGKVAVAGFCWGGAQAFRLATTNSKTAATLVFYGVPPEGGAGIEKIAAPVHGFYGENDQRVNASIDDTRQKMAAAAKTYEPQIYPGAGHGFMRLGEDPAGSEADRAARTAAWERLKKILTPLR